MMWKCTRARAVLLVPVFVLGVGDCVHTELYGPYDCFEKNGLMVFGSTGSVNCIDRTTYARRHLNEEGSVAVTDLDDPAALLD